MKFFVESFGCQMNSADTEEMGRHLAARGFAATADRDAADWVLVNTCTVRQHAEQKALSYLGRLRDWKDAKPGRRLVVAGCAAERLQDSLRRRFPHVDLVVGAISIGRFPELADGLLPAGEFDARGEAADAWSPENDYTAYTRGFPVGHVTIMRGCNYSCAYCIVPRVRGREIYRPAESVLAEVGQKAAAGCSEILLLGQTVNSYRPADGPIQDFADLLRAVDKVPGVRRLRFMSPHPFYVNERFAAAVAESPNVCPHMHLPVQSGSTPVLRRMRRNYSRADFLARAALLRRFVPGIALTTDIIVGFPGETDDDFKDTLSLIDEADLDGAYSFKYSPRPGTDAAEGPDDVPREKKEERLAVLLESLERRAQEKTARLIGTAQEVLVESAGVENGVWTADGRTRRFWKVRLSSKTPLKIGDTVNVKIQEAPARVLKGEAHAA